MQITKNYFYLAKFTPRFADTWQLEQGGHVEPYCSCWQVKVGAKHVSAGT
jgi:hypothetical protein